MRDSSVRVPTSTHASDSDAVSIHPFVQLQQQAGNQAVQQLLRSGAIQAKLAISNPDDAEERDADNVAHMVMRSHAGAPASSPCSCSGNGEMCEECQQKQSHPTISRRASAPSAPAHVPKIVNEVLRSPGHPLDSATRAFFEPRFGHDFSHVRIHTDTQAATSAQSIQAHAYAAGPNIAFAAGQFAPSQYEGQKLIAHELAHVVQQDDDSGYPVRTIWRQPAPPDSQSAPAKRVDYPPWAQSTPEEALPGDPVADYEAPRASYTPADAAEMSRQVYAREIENEANAGAFLGDFAEALTDLWGKQVTEAMKEAAEDAGWSFFKKLLKFVVIKGVEWTLAAALTPAGAAFFEALEVKVSENILEKATEAGFGYYMETKADKREEAAKSAKLEEKKKDLDSITERFASLMKALPRETLTGLPKVSPYLEWLRNAQPYQLAKFRLPPLFPRVKASDIRATVAGLIVSLLHGIVKVRSSDWADPTRVDYYDDDIIVVRDFRWAQIYSPSREIVKAIAGRVPISKVPLVPLYIQGYIQQGYSPGTGELAAARQLLTAFRGFGQVSQKEIDDFVSAYGYNPSHNVVVVTRNPVGDIEVSGHGLASDLKLYMVGTGDSDLVTLSSEVLAWAHGEADYLREIGTAPDEGVSRPVETADLAKKTRFYLEVGNDQRLAWAKTLITNEIEKLVPEKPTDRFN